jgi:hypothetical protein
LESQKSKETTSAEPLRVIAYDADQAVYDVDVRNPLMLWGRLVHHILFFDEVVLTDSAVVTNSPLPQVIVEHNIVDLCSLGVLRVALRAGKSLEEVAVDDFKQTHNLTYIAKLNACLSHSASAVLPYQPDDVARLYTTRIDEFIGLHHGRNWTNLTDEAAKEYLRQMDWIIEKALSRKHDGPHLRRNFHVWDPKYYNSDELSGLGTLDHFVKSRVESSVATPYYSTVAEHLNSTGIRITRWLSQHFGRAAVASHRLTQPNPSDIEDAARRAWQAGAEAVPGNLLRYNIGWLLNPTDEDYRLLGLLVDDADQLMRLRELGPCGDRRAMFIGDQFDEFSLGALLRLNDALLKMRRDKNIDCTLNPGANDALIQLRVREDTFLLRVPKTQNPEDLVTHYSPLDRIMSFQIELPGEMSARMQVSPPVDGAKATNPGGPGVEDKVYAELSLKP